MNKFFNHIKVIEINPTELCNLKCNFCPRSTFYPNQNLNMSLDTAKEIRKQLDDLKYKGIVSITGRGEPTLHPKFEELSNIFIKDRSWVLKINTNGKKINDYIDTIWEYDQIFYNLYDHTKKELDQIFKIYEKHFHKIKLNHTPINMDWAEKKYFTNRAGSFKTNNIPSSSDCDMIFLKMFIDFDGTYRLCCEDWKEKISLGNIYDQTISEYIENNTILQKYRLKLAAGDRSLSPCNGCSYNMESGRNRCSKKEWAKIKELTLK